MDIRLKETRFEYRGVAYTLRCNMNVLADVQEAFGGKISTALGDDAVLRSCLEFLAAMINDSADEQGLSQRFTAREVGRDCGLGMAELRKLIFPLVNSALIPEEEGGKGRKN